MAWEQQGDHRFFQERSRRALKVFAQLQYVNDDHTSTIERVCLCDTPNFLSLSHDPRHALNCAGRK
jgi:hypothetical protein